MRKAAKVKRKAARPRKKTTTRTRSTAPAVPGQLADVIDRSRDAALIKSAQRKLAQGVPPSKAESNAIRRREKQKEIEFREWCYANVPKKDFLRMSGGRQGRTINEMGRRWGLPCDGPTIDLNAFFRDLWQFLVDNTRALNATHAQAVPDSRDRRREIQTQKSEIELATMRGQVVKTADVSDGLEALAAILRSAAETIKREYGAGPHEVLDDALDEIDREIAARFAGGGE